MNTLKKYKNQLKKNFFVSVKKDIDKWTSSRTDYWSPSYNGTYFRIDKNDFCDYLNIYTDDNQGNTNNEFICIYRWLIFPVNIKVWYYVKKLSYHFKKLEKDNKVSKNIEVLKIGLENVEKEFIKELRKEKLEKIGN